MRIPQFFPSTRALSPELRYGKAPDTADELSSPNPPFAFPPILDLLKKDAVTISKILPPGLHRSITQKVASKAGSGFGVNPVRLIQMEEKLYRATASQVDSQGYVIGPPAYLEDMFGAKRATGLGRTLREGPLLSDWISKLVQEGDSLGTQAVVGRMVEAARIPEIAEHRSVTGREQWKWRTQSDKGVRDGTITFVQQQVRSMFEGVDRLPPMLRSYGRYIDMSAHGQQLSPWMQERKPEVFHAVREAVRDLHPPWMTERNGGSGPMAHRSDPAKVEKVHRRLSELGVSEPTPFADCLIGLESHIQAQEQSSWFKLLRETPPERRTSLLEPLAKIWSQLCTSPAAEKAEDLPTIQRFRPTDRVTIADKYERAEGLAGVVDHTLKALSPPQREAFRQDLLTQLRGQRDTLVQQDARVKEIFEAAGGSLADYPGVDLDALLQEKDPAAITWTALSAMQLATAGEQAEPPLVFPGQVNLSDEDRLVVRRHLAAVGWLASQKERFAPSDISLLSAQPGLAANPIITGPYGVTSGVSSKMVEATLSPAPKTSLSLGSGTLLTSTPVSVVLEGGGGKGFAFASNLKKLYGTLQNAPGSFRVDEFCGTSAGAITASLLAAGYTPDELGDVMKELSFAKFFSDHQALSSGDDPQVGGIDRAGLFSTRAMEQEIEALLAKKLNIEGRPVTFADLPFKLKVPSTLLATNAPEDVLQILGHDAKSGRLVFSTENTPNMSVAAAATASGAFPGAFQPPTMEVLRPEVGPSGEVEARRYWIQCSDGGILDNFPLGLAGEANEKIVTTVLPASYTDGEHGDLSLATLDFDASRADGLEATHQKFYHQHGAGLSQFFGQLAGDPEQRLVVAFNLCEEQEQRGPVVSGATPQDTSHLHSLAQGSGLAVLSPEAGQALIAENREKSYGFKELVIATILDPKPFGRSQETEDLPSRPMADFLELARTVMKRQRGAAS